MNLVKCVFLSLLLFLIGEKMVSQKLRVASYNLRYDNPGDSLNNWKYRKEVVGGLIKFHDFDIFGSQEGLHHQLEELLKELPSYSYIGVGRDDGKKEGEYAAIFYKTDMFELIEKGDFWLSQDSTYPNKGWDAVLPRICSWGKFKEKSSGFIFYFFNVHFDHVGTLARNESAKLILQKIDLLAGNLPTLLTGDFNVDQHSDSYKLLKASQKLKDAFDEALFKYGAEGTFNRFEVNTRSQSRIDHVFVSDDFQVLVHGILTDTYQTSESDLLELANSGTYPKEIILYRTTARLPSDHYPVLTILEVQEKN